MDPLVRWFGSYWGGLVGGSTASTGGSASGRSAGTPGASTCDAGTAGTNRRTVYFVVCNQRRLKIIKTLQKKFIKKLGKT